MDDVESPEDMGGAGPLFSRSASRYSDNAEIVDGGNAARDAGLWAVSANEPSPTASDSVSGDPYSSSFAESDGSFAGDDLWDPITDDDPVVPTFPPPPFGQPYRSPLIGKEPVVPASGTESSDRWADWWDGEPAAEPAVEEGLIAEAEHDPYDDVFEASVVEEPAPAQPYAQEVFTEGTGSDDELFDHAYSSTSHEHNDTAGHDSSTEEPDEQPYEHSYEEPYEAPYDPYARDVGRDTVGSLFRSEPVDRRADVVDSQDDLEPEPFEEFTASSPFSSGSPTADPDPRPHSYGGFAPTEPDVREPVYQPTSRVGGVGDDHPDFVGEANTPGFLEAINRLDEADRARARTALVVAGALLDDDDPVLGILAGQMLGHAAVFVVTLTKVLIVNDRTWQPVVDRYRIDDSLDIRGRHDRNMAAIGLGDGRQLSMVDGIRDVAGAIDLVDRIRSMIGDI